MRYQNKINLHGCKSPQAIASPRKPWLNEVASYQLTVTSTPFGQSLGFFPEKGVTKDLARQICVSRNLYFMHIIYIFIRAVFCQSSPLYLLFASNIYEARVK